MSKKKSKLGTNYSILGSLIGGGLILFLLWSLYATYTEQDFLGLQKERYHEAVKRAHEVLENFQSHFVVDSSEVKSEPVRGGNPGIPSQDANRISQFQITKNKPSHTTDVVIGMAQKTDPKNLVVFCASLRKASQADIVLFVDTPVPELNKKILHQHQVIVIPFSLTDLPPSMASFHPSTYRWHLIHKFFQNPENREKYKRVWMIDVRDSFFQSDPFEMIPLGTSAFFAFKGVELQIEQCGWNGPWVSDCFGMEMLKYIGSNTIICSGVSVGSIDTVLPYLDQVNTLIQGNTIVPYITQNKFPSCERNGVDQGIHNVLVHTKQIQNLKIWSQSNSPVLNLQAKHAKVQGILVKNLKDEIVPVVHQYDRYPDLQKALFREYVDWVNTSDPMAEWNQLEACRSYGYVLDRDLFKGKCDFKIKGGATGPSSCCGFCNEISGCAAFTFFNGQCFLKKPCGKPSTGPFVGGAVSGFLKS